MNTISSKYWTNTQGGSTPFHGKHTIPELLQFIRTQYGDQDGLGFRKLFAKQIGLMSGMKIPVKTLAETYTYISYGEFIDQVETLSKSLTSLGVKAGDRVALYLDTRIEWLAWFFAVVSIGGIIIPLYPTLGQDGLIHCMTQPKVATIILGLDRLSMIHNNQDKLPLIKTVIYVPDIFYSESGDELKVESPSHTLKDSITVYSMRQMESLGQSAPVQKMYQVKPDDLIMINYTSGSTGVPKGVIFDHERVMRAAESMSECSVRNPSSILSYLPLSHVFEFTATLATFPLGAKVHFSSPYTLFPRSPGLDPFTKPDITLAKPNMLVGVPLIMDRVKKAVMSMMKEIGIDLEPVLMGADPSDYPLQDVKEFMAQMTGGEVHFIAIGSAAVSRSTELFWKVIAQIPVKVGYGATEGAGSSCAQPPQMLTDDFHMGAVGHAMLHVKMRLKNWEEGGYYHNNNEGELIFSSPGLAIGYFELPEETDNSFLEVDGERYWCSGDIVRIEEQGDEYTVKIIDRKKELHKLNNGEYISLAKIEAELRAAPAIELICVTSDAENNCLIALVTPNKEPYAKLKEEAKEKDVSVESLLLDQLKEVAKKASLRGPEVPQMVMVCEEDWNPINGLTTASMKIKRKALNCFYRNRVEKMVTDGRIR